MVSLEHTLLFAKAVEHAVPLRGAIGLGEAYCSAEENILVSPALVRTYKLAESSEWLGIIVEDSVADASREALVELVRSEFHLCRWAVSFANGMTRDHWVLDWPVALRRYLHTDS